MSHQHIRITVADAEPPGTESIPAEPHGNAAWKTLRSPLYATGFAAGDVVRVLDKETGAFELVSRGGNVCVQLYLAESDADDADATARIAGELSTDVEAHGGVMDAHTPGLIAFTLPVDIGFPAIEEIFTTALERHPGAQWQYSNVYDPTTGEPLGWWE